jgi:hypothetical protein
MSEDFRRTSPTDRLGSPLQRICHNVHSYGDLTDLAKLNRTNRRHLEIAFESSCAIVRLAGLKESKEFADLHEQIIAGELSVHEAVQIVVAKYTVVFPRGK